MTDSDMPNVRRIVLNSLSAVGALREAEFYADLFNQQDAEKFALIVLDPRCLKNPLLEAFISNIRILTHLGLFPLLVVGAISEDRTGVKFQGQRLSQELQAASIMTSKLNTATYGLIPEIKKSASHRKTIILEITESDPRFGLNKLVADLRPSKVIFLQPSGGVNVHGRRVPVINLGEAEAYLEYDLLNDAQAKFMKHIIDMGKLVGDETVYVVASPLNLMAELFTTKGSGTLIRHAAKILNRSSYKTLKKAQILESIEQAFERKLTSKFSTRKVLRVFVEENYRGGAIFTGTMELPYLSKFWVVREARGEGLASDIWTKCYASMPRFYWRSRQDNPFNDWYMRACDGMQINYEWRIFWKGLNSDQISEVIKVAPSSPLDFR